MPGMVVQMRARGDDAPPRVGFTATKKIGNAVVRNRMKRRLRALAREFATKEIRPRAAAYDIEMTHPADVIARAHEVGLMNPHLPEELGGDAHRADRRAIAAHFVQRRRGRLGRTRGRRHENRWS